RNASALKASSYLRRLSGIFLLFSTLMTQEIYVLLLRCKARTSGGPTRVGSLATGKPARA
nr:hypothetical protein [Tanacetum cinerariifolium]